VVNETGMRPFRPGGAIGCELCGIEKPTADANFWNVRGKRYSARRRFRRAEKAVPPFGCHRIPYHSGETSQMTAGGSLINCLFRINWVAGVFCVMAAGFRILGVRQSLKYRPFTAA
jgi:hypothetical protein